MKNLFKLSISFLLFLIIFPSSTFASEVVKDAKILSQFNSVVRIYDSETNEVIEKSITPSVTKTTSINLFKNGGESEIKYSASYEYIYEDESFPQISPFIVDSSTRDWGDVKITINVDYSVNKSTEQFKVTRFFGSWVPTGYYYVSNRTAGIHPGLASGKTFQAYPTGNTFGYSPGWGELPITGLGDTNARAWVEARINVQGMTAYRIVYLDTVYATPHDFL